MDESRQKQRLLEAACTALQLPPDLLLSEWADKYRYLSSEASAKRGKWQTLPYQREPLDVLSPSHPCQIAVYRCASQIMKTEILLCLLGYVIHMDPGPALFVEPRTEDAKALSKDRVAPMLRDTPALRGKVAKARSRDTDNTTLHKAFTGGHVTFTGAISPSGLAMRPVRYLFLDEVNRYPISAGTEGDPVRLAIRRTDTFDLNKKIAIASTPTGKGGSIDRWYEISDQREYHVPCPECGEYQVLKFERLRWNQQEAKPGQTIDAQYECQHCSALIPHYRKPWMVAQGKWIARNPESKIPGFHLSQMYALHRSWGQLAEEWLDAERNVETAKTFWNTVLAESWEERADAPDYEKLMSRRESYRLGQVPDGVLFLTSGVDVQKTWLEGYVYGWGRRGQRWVVDHFRIEHSPYDPVAWEALTERLNATYQHPGGVDLSIVRMAVDTGFATQEVYGWARHHVGRVLPIDGRPAGPAILCNPIPVDLTLSGRKVRRGIKIWPINVSMAKHELYGFLSRERPAEGEPWPHGWVHFAEDLEQEFFQQLTAEQVIARSVNGYQKFEWIKTRDRNEALDCAVYARAAAISFGVDKFSEQRWCELESHLATPPAVAAQVQAQSAGQPPSPPDSLRVAAQPSSSRPVGGGWFGGGNTGGWFSR